MIIFTFDLALFRYVFHLNYQSWKWIMRCNSFFFLFWTQTISKGLTMHERYSPQSISPFTTSWSYKIQQVSNRWKSGRIFLLIQTALMRPCLDIHALLLLTASPCVAGLAGIAGRLLVGFQEAGVRESATQTPPQMNADSRVLMDSDTGQELTGRMNEGSVSEGD